MIANTVKIGSATAWILRGHLSAIWIVGIPQNGIEKRRIAQARSHDITCRVNRFHNFISDAQQTNVIENGCTKLIITRVRIVFPPIARRTTIEPAFSTCVIKAWFVPNFKKLDEIMVSFDGFPNIECVIVRIIDGRAVFAIVPYRRVHILKNR